MKKPRAHFLFSFAMGLFIFAFACVPNGAFAFGFPLNFPIDFSSGQTQTANVIGAFTNGISVGWNNIKCSFENIFLKNADLSCQKPLLTLTAGNSPATTSPVYSVSTDLQPNGQSNNQSDDTAQQESQNSINSISVSLAASTSTSTAAVAPVNNAPATIVWSQTDITPSVAASTSSVPATHVSGSAPASAPAANPVNPVVQKGLTLAQVSALINSAISNAELSSVSSQPAPSSVSSPVYIVENSSPVSGDVISDSVGPALGQLQSSLTSSFNAAIVNQIANQNGSVITNGTFSGTLSGPSLTLTSSSPASTTDLLYQNSGVLYWEGTPVGSAGGSGVWGSIAGTLSNQTDLQSALNQKLSIAAWASTTTDALAEGITNLYYTTARATGAANAAIDATTSIPNITTLSGLTSAPNLALSASNITAGTLAVGIGGTGSSSYSVGSLLLGSSTNPLYQLVPGATGSVLSIVGGLPTYVATGTLGLQSPITLTTSGTSGAATFSGNTLNVPQYSGTNYFTNSSATTSLNTGTILAASTGTFGTVNATSTTATSSFPILRDGEIADQHPDGSWTYTIATTSTNIGRGNALLYAISQAQSGDSLYLASSTFDVASSSVDLSMGNTGTLSIHGSGEYQTIITTSGSNNWLVVPGLYGSQTTDLTLQSQGLQSGNQTYLWGSNTVFYKNAQMKNVNLVGISDAIYSSSASTAQSATFTNVSATSQFDVVVLGNGTFNIYDSSFTPVATGYQTHYARGLLALKPGSHVNIYDSVFSATGGDTYNHGVEADNGATIYLNGDSITTANTSPIDLYNDGASTINVTSNTVYNPTKTSGTITFVDNPQLSYSLGSSGASSTILVNANGVATWVGTSSLGTLGINFFTNSSSTATTSLSVGSILAAGTGTFGTLIATGTLTVTSTSTLTGLKLTNLASTFLAVDANGNVIATTTPAFTNFFTNSAATTSLSTGSILTATTGTFGNINATTTTATSTFSGNVVVGSSTAPVALAVSSAGNVGIGQSNPFYVLDVNGDIGDSNNSDYRIGQNGDTTYFNAVNGGSVGIGSSTPIATLAVKGSGGTNPFVVASSSGAEFLTVLANGNFGIGSSTPGSLLSVGGNAYFSGNVTASGTLTVTSTSTLTGLKITNLSSTILAVDANGNVIATSSGDINFFTNSGATTTLVVGSIFSAGTGTFGTVNATSTTGTSTFSGSFVAGNGALTTDANSGITTISALQTGPLNFDTDAGVVSWTNLPLDASSTVGTAESFSAQIANNPILTVYGLANGSGGVTNTAVGIGTSTPSTTLDVAGDITDENVKGCDSGTHALGTDANGQIVCDVSLSDQRLKTQINSLDGQNALNLIDSLNPVSFYWIDPTIPGTGSTQEQFGFIAQEVDKVAPNLVATTSPTYLTPDGTYYLNYQGIISPLVKAVQEQELQITSISSSTATTTTGVPVVTLASLSTGLGSLLAQVNASSTQLASAITSLTSSTASTTAYLQTEINNLASTSALFTSSSNASSTAAQLSTSQSFIQAIANAVISILQSSGQVIQSAGNWAVSKLSATVVTTNDVQTQTIETQTATVANGINMMAPDGQAWCVQVDNDGNLTRTLGWCPWTTNEASSTASTTATTTAVVIPQTPTQTPAPTSTSTSTSTSTPTIPMITDASSSTSSASTTLTVTASSTTSTASTTTTTSTSSATSTPSTNSATSTATTTTVITTATATSTDQSDNTGPAATSTTVALPPITTPNLGTTTTPVSTPTPSDDSNASSSGQ